MKKKFFSFFKKIIFFQLHFPYAYCEPIQNFAICNLKIKYFETYITYIFITYFENHTLFCKNKLYEKVDAQIVPKIENQLRAFIRSDQLIGNKDRQILHCLDAII